MQKKNSTHLSADDRIRIEALLCEAYSLRYIADRLDKSPSTISREISKHTQVHGKIQSGLCEAVVFSCRWQKARFYRNNLP